MKQHHPIQPIEKDDKGVLRFKANKIVRYLLDHGNINMNDLAVLSFSREDRQQFAQLIGYSLSGYGELSYVDDDAYCTAEEIARSGESENKAKIAYLEDKLNNLRKELVEPMANLFGVHPDDLSNNIKEE